MDKLYGEEMADAVYRRCQELSPQFNELVQTFVYDIFWAKPGLALKEKSLITIVTLIALQKSEQLQIHLQGFFHLGGTFLDITALLKYMVSAQYIRSGTNTLAMLDELAAKMDIDKGVAIDISHRHKAFIDLTAHITIGEQDKTQSYISQLLKEQILTTEEIENTMLHQMLYGGFPCAMNGLAALRQAEISSTQGLKS